MIAYWLCSTWKELEQTYFRFVAVQKLREKKLVSDDGAVEIVTKITREQTSKNVSFDTHGYREQDGENLAGQVWKDKSLSFIREASQNGSPKCGVGSGGPNVLEIIAFMAYLSPFLSKIFGTFTFKFPNLLAGSQL